VIDHIDHIVLTTRDREGCIRFYTQVLGMKLESFGENRLALSFGSQKINLHEWGREFTPRAHVAAPGTLDLCFIASVPLEDVIARLRPGDAFGTAGSAMPAGWPDSMRDMSGSGPRAPSFHGVWQSLQPIVRTRYAPSSAWLRAGGLAAPAGAWAPALAMSPARATALVVRAKVANRLGLIGVSMRAETRGSP